MRPVFAHPTDTAIPVHVIAADSLEQGLQNCTTTVANMCKRQGFTGAIGQAVFAPDGAGGYCAVVGYGTTKTRKRGRFHIAAGAAKLPSGAYRLVADLDADVLEIETLGWLLAGYQFTRYKSGSDCHRGIIAPNGVDSAKILAMAEAEFLCRDLINTPANDMGPQELEDTARELAKTHNAAISVISGDALLDHNFPLIHAVGRASPRAPRLIDMTWGTTGKKITLVGKGVCFDTGGLDIKPASSMGLMKKDMGGSANVLALAHMIMATKSDVQLRVLIPAVENSVSGNAFRPQDVLPSRAGFSVEINNTDAEGRLVLADALALASETNPDVIISMATLTGAARVAVGPDLSPFFADDDKNAAAVAKAAEITADPVWRMPFWDPYEAMIEPGIADLDNAPSGGFAGSITAALFLRRFVKNPDSYLHFDIYGWTPSPMPARPKGGALMAARALFAALPNLGHHD